MDSHSGNDGVGGGVISKGLLVHSSTPQLFRVIQNSYLLYNYELRFVLNNSLSIFYHMYVAVIWNSVAKLNVVLLFEYQVNINGDYRAIHS